MRLLLNFKKMFFLTFESPTTFITAAFGTSWLPEPPHQTTDFRIENRLSLVVKKCKKTLGRFSVLFFSISRYHFPLYCQLPLLTNESIFFLQCIARLISRIFFGTLFFSCTFRLCVLTYAGFLNFRWHTSHA